MEGATGVQDAVNAYAQWTTLGEAVTDFQYTKGYRPGSMRADDVGLFSYFDVYQHDGRHCVNGAWESLASYTQNLVTSLNMVTAVHEFGHDDGVDPQLHGVG